METLSQLSYTPKYRQRFNTAVDYLLYAWHIGAPFVDYRPLPRYNGGSRPDA